MKPFAASAYRLCWSDSATIGEDPPLMSGLFLSKVMAVLCGADARFGERRRPVRVIVDRDACEANAICAGLVPEVFEVDDDDVLRILVAEVPAGLRDAVAHAVTSCPKAALSLAD